MSRSPSYSGAAVESDGGGGVSIPHRHRKFHTAIKKNNQKCMGDMVIHESYTQETPEYTLLPIPQKSTKAVQKYFHVRTDVRAHETIRVVYHHYDLMNNLIDIKRKQS
jgi:hypothetical protein